MTEPRRPTDAPPISKDPRLRRTTSYNTTEGISSPIHERRDPFSPREGASTRANTPQGSDGNAVKPFGQEVGQNDSVKTLRSLISSAVDAGLLGRKRDYLVRELKTARDQYERAQRESKHFPVVIEQTEQDLKRIEVSYNSAKQEADEQNAKESTIANDVLRIFVGLSAKPGLETLTAEMRAMKQELETVQATQSSERKHAEERSQALAKVSAQNNSLINRVAVLEDTIKKQEEGLKTLQGLQQQVVALRNDFSELSKAQKSGKSTEQLAENEAFRKSIQLKTKNNQDVLEAVEYKLSLLQHDVSVQNDNAAVIQKEVDKLKNTKDEMAKLKSSDEGRSKTIASLRQDYITQVKDLKNLRDDITQVKMDVSKSLLDHKAKAMNDLAQHMDDRIAQVTVESDLANARHTNISKEVQRMDKDFSTILEGLQRDIKKLRETSVTQPTASTAVSEDHVTAILQRVEVVEGHVNELQKGLEIQRHHFQSLDHRFNNLDTMKLYQRIMQVVAPVLPRFEQSLVKMTEKVENMEHKLEHTEPKQDTDVEQARKSELAEEKLAELKISLESLAAEFREGRDKIKEEIHEILVARMKSANEESSYRDATKDKLQGIQDQINDLRQTTSLADSTKRPNPDSDFTGFSIKGRSQAASGVPQPPTPGQSRYEQLPFQNTRANGRMEEANGDETIPDEMEASALLEKFKRPPTSSSQTSREDSTGRPLGKRKRHERNDSEEPIIAESEDEPPSRSRRKNRR